MADTHDDNIQVADSYGPGEPFDRLQFGYKPAIPAEAIAFHAATPAAKWIKRRKANYATTILKRQKLVKSHFEPVTSMFKLKDHWKQVAEFRNKQSGKVDFDEAEEFLKFLTEKQSVGSGAQNGKSGGSKPAFMVQPVAYGGHSKENNDDDDEEDQVKPSNTKHRAPVYDLGEDDDDDSNAGGEAVHSHRSKRPRYDV